VEKRQSCVDWLRSDTARAMKAFGRFVRQLLAHPLTRGIDLDDPRTTALRRQIIETKPFLRRIYHEWYEALVKDLPVGDGRVLELGSGAGFLRQFLPEVITTELFTCPGIDVVMSALQMGLADGSLRAIVMTDVFHHLPDVRQFLREAARTIRPGGVIAMIEPWRSTWSHFVYTKLHHEPFRPHAAKWEFPTTGPLSGANQALAWVVFQRDRGILEREFPQWRVEKVEPFMPVRYLLSGGVSMRSLAPTWSYGAIRGMENLLGSKLAMFCHILLRRRENV
jgi:SAM-dependent methyltransferase